MSFIDDEFYRENMDSVNRIIATILLLMNILCPLFILFSKLDVFHIKTSFSLVCALIIAPVSIIDVVSVYRFNIPKFSMYFGLISMSLIVGLLGSNFHIGIYIGYALVAIISCLYYSVSVSVFMIVFCYLCMLVSIYYKGVNGFHEGCIPSVVRYLITYGLTFTIEYFFVFVVVIALARRCSFTLKKSMDNNEKLRNTQLEIMDFIPKILESHELFTGHHVKHTVKYVDIIAREMARQGNYTDILTEETIRMYSAAANLHDIGKVHIPDHILNKPGKFTPEEFSMMKNHPIEGKKLIEALPRIKNGNFNEIAIQMAYFHHEKYDGSGYPNGLSGKAIPLCARIMSAADVLDALLCWRPYKQPYDIEETIKLFQEAKGTHFEPCIVDAIVSLKPIIYMMAQEFRTKEMDEEEKEFYWRQKLRDEMKKGNGDNMMFGKTLII